jgi:large subunit ribosomal protein L35e
MTAKQRMSELMPKKSKELLKQVEELKTELNALKVAKVTGGTASKVGKIRLFRKNIARVLTAISHKAREKMRSEIKAQCGGHGLKRVPKQLRAKKTRAIRRQLTPAQLGKTTVKAAKKARNFPLRQYVVEAS